MAISVYSIYFVAFIVALGAAALSVGVLLDTFSQQRRQREAAQRDTGVGQVKAIQSLVLAQLHRMQTCSEGNLNHFLLYAISIPPENFHPKLVIRSLNSTIFTDWLPRVNAVGQLNGFGLTLMYPAGTPAFDRSFQVYADGLMDGSRLYMYTYTYEEDNLLHAFSTTWVRQGGASLPALGAEEYNFDWFPSIEGVYQNDDFFDVALPWASSDGNSYWYFTHQRAFTVHGLSGIIQTWDDAITWREKMLSVRVPGSEFAIFDSNGHVLATTNAAEAMRLGMCRGLFSEGTLATNCIDAPAADYPVEELRQVYLALLLDPEWHDLSAPAVPFRSRKILLNGTQYLTIAGTIFSEDRLRATIVWYQPWATDTGNISGVSALIGVMTVLSTLVLTLMGIFGILRPLLRLGQGMRAVARSLREGDQDTTLQARKPSPFTEVDRIARDFETIVVDFLGFSNKVVRDNRNAPKDDTKPFAILFTDIESSTGLWGFDPANMSRCLQTHHELIRDLIAAHHLYEVKTVGDSFMLASASAGAMLRFALDLQETFHRHEWEWPDVEDFYEDAHRGDGEGMAGGAWNGLRVRVGLHYGSGEIVYDEVTKGFDYYGTVVNTAARIEAAGHGGQVVASEAVLTAGGLVDPTQFVVERLGVQPLRGVEDPPALLQLVPVSLLARSFPALRLEKGDEVLKARASLAASVFSEGETPRESVFRTMNADDFARSHSLVRAGVLPMEMISRHLQSLRTVIEELLLPVPPQQRRGTTKAILGGWGVPLPRADLQLPSALLQVAQRMSETPKALRRLRSAHEGTKSNAQLHLRQASSVSNDLSD